MDCFSSEAQNDGERGTLEYFSICMNNSKLCCLMHLISQLYSLVIFIYEIERDGEFDRKSANRLAPNCLIFVF